MARNRSPYPDAACVRAAAMASRPMVPVTGARVFPWKVAIGPYHYSVLWADETTMESPRYLAEECPNQQVIRLSTKLSGVRLVKYFLRSALFLTLYAAGVNNRKIDEEQATHLLATGFVALIVRNPEVCAWFTELLMRHPRTIRPKTVGRISPPRAVHLGQSEYAITGMGPTVAARAAQWGDIDLNARVVRLNEDLQGAHIGVIFWHEVLHGIHKERGLRGTVNKDVAYLRAQTEGIVGFVRENPLAWRWFVAILRRAALAQTPVPRRRKSTGSRRAAPSAPRLRLAA